jgi:hypothetical protein
MEKITPETVAVQALVVEVPMVVLLEMQAQATTVVLVVDRDQTQPQVEQRTMVLE